MPSPLARDALLDTPARHAPIAPGHVLVRGVSSCGLPVACRVDPREAARLQAQADAHRRRMADRRRLVAIVDDPAHRAEACDLAATLSRPSWPDR